MVQGFAQNDRRRAFFSVLLKVAATHLRLRHYAKASRIL
jgi:hypothetical protein